MGPSRFTAKQQRCFTELFVRISSVLLFFPMPPKAANELTIIENTLLGIAARVLAAAKRVEEGPPLSLAQQELFNSNVVEELVSSSYQISRVLLLH